MSGIILKIKNQKLKKNKSNNKATLSDIAKELGVSTALVSMVLNNKGKENRISEEMCKTVFKKAEELNYKPNLLARSLRTGKSSIIALIVADISTLFFAQLGKAIELEAEKHGYSVMFCSTDESSKKTEHLLKLLKERQVEGFIISPVLNDEANILQLKKDKSPLVLVDRFYHKIKTNHVIINNYQAAFDGTNEIIKAGKKRIGTLIFNTSMNHMKDRLKGYREALKQASIPFKNDIVKEVSFENMKEDVKNALDNMVFGPKPVDGLVFLTDELSIHGLEYLKDNNVKIPETLSVYAFDDGIMLKLHTPPVSAIKQPVQEMGKQAVQILIENIKNPDMERKEIVLDHKMIIRESV